MIGWPENEAEHKWFRNFLVRKGAAVITPEAHIICWHVKGIPTWVVAYDEFCGATCQMHWASENARYLPRELIHFAFRYSFNVLKLRRVFGLINSTNTSALRITLWLGFKEVYRAEDCHHDGGDIVFLEMRADNCTWTRIPNGQRLSTDA